jgi:molybdopterin/thiamine biosynthesis adenylyltransferase/rhodanese-related sulfurtransferase
VKNQRPPTTDLSSEEIRRYERHFVLPDIGEEGQKRLKSASVLIVGAGGLGSPAAIYLAAAGIGRLGIIDSDDVDHSNLQRQILYNTSDVGKSKVELAKKRIVEINPNVEVRIFSERLTSKNALSIFSPYDVIIDGSDNLPTRYLVNDACVMLNKPDVYGGIFQFEGQASVFDAKQGPCYRCLFPEPPPPELVPTCAEGGVLGVLPGIIGSIQATEAIKIIVGFGETLVGRLILLDAAKMDFRELKLEKVKSCPMCGENRTITALIDYEEFCGLKPKSSRGGQAGPANEISPQTLRERLDRGEPLVLLDVREPYEYRLVHLDARLLPLGELESRISELDPSKETVVYCHSGIRSSSAVKFLRSRGFKNVKNLTGGIDAWARTIDQSMIRY